MLPSRIELFVVLASMSVAFLVALAILSAAYLACRLVAHLWAAARRQHRHLRGQIR